MATNLRKRFQTPNRITRALHGRASGVRKCCHGDFHRPGCHPARPRCKARRIAKYGHPCQCGVLGFIHRQGSAARINSVLVLCNYGPIEPEVLAQIRAEERAQRAVDGAELATARQEFSVLFELPVAEPTIEEAPPVSTVRPRARKVREEAPVLVADSAIPGAAYEVRRNGRTVFDAKATRGRFLYARSLARSTVEGGELFAIVDGKAYRVLSTREAVKLGKGAA